MLSVLLQRVPTIAHATLNGYQRHSLSGRNYPGIVECPGQRVEGRLLLDLSPAELDTLDAFEGPEYERRVVRIAAGGGGGADEQDAAAYVFAADRRELGGDWSYEAWREAHLQAFVRMCSAFAEEMREAPLEGAQATGGETAGSRLKVEDDRLIDGGRR